MEFTYDPTPADQPEFSAEELDSLQVGEAMQEAEDRMLAGKYENAEQLEKAYLELQSKLGSQADSGDEQGDVPEEEEYSEEEEAETNEEEYTETEQLILAASDEYYSENGLSEETYNQLAEMDSQELLDTYLQLQQQQQQPTASQDLSEREVDSIYAFAGGAEQFNAITEWAGQNMSEEYINAYDRIVEQGDSATIQLAVAGLMAAYYENNGYEGRMYSGQQAQAESAPYFRSQAEVVEAMSDPRYENDPAYRQDVYDALERSNLQY